MRTTHKTPIHGVAVSGVASAIVVPRYRVCLDIGDAIPASLAQKTILISHGHLDHVDGVVKHACIRHMRTQKPTHIFCEPRLVPLIHEYFKLVGKFQPTRVPDYTVTGCELEERVWLSPKRFIRAFPTHHSLSSQGYVCYEVRDKLLPELVGKNHLDLLALRRQGKTITSQQEVPVVAYTGDTRASVFDVETDIMDDVRRAELLITEATFIGTEEPPGFARSRGHTHLDELADRAECFQNDELTLVHFSARYTNKRIEEAIEKLPAVLRDKTSYLPV
jgi:ribonuclease Z